MGNHGCVGDPMSPTFDFLIFLIFFSYFVNVFFIYIYFFVFLSILLISKFKKQ